MRYLSALLTCPTLQAYFCHPKGLVRHEYTSTMISDASVYTFNRSTLVRLRSAQRLVYSLDTYHPLPTTRGMPNTRENPHTCRTHFQLPPHQLIPPRIGAIYFCGISALASTWTWPSCVPLVYPQCSDAHVLSHLQYFEMRVRVRHNDEVMRH